MTKTSERLNRLAESATLAMARMSTELKAEGKCRVQIRRSLIEFPIGHG